MPPEKPTLLISPKHFVSYVIVISLILYSAYSYVFEKDTMSALIYAIFGFGLLSVAKGLPRMWRIASMCLTLVLIVSFGVYFATL